MVNVEFTTTDLSYTVCCKKYDYTGKTVTVNPIGNELLPTVETRTDSKQSVTFQKLGPVPSSNIFTGDMYTLIAVDPDVPIPAVANESHPLVHQLKVNIVDGNFTTGDEVQDWRGPFPPDSAHYYYFLLYKQQGSINANQMTSYAGNCSGRVAGRCLYDINRAVNDLNLVLVGASWFRSTKDDYVLYRSVVRSPTTVATQCAGQPGFPADCVAVIG